MTDPIQCQEVQDLAPEVAIGVASAQDRAGVLGHTGTCADCAALLLELSALVDDIAALAPTHEPPAGFESDVLSRIAEFRSPVALPRAGHKHRVRRVALAAAALVTVAALSGSVVYQAHDSDRTLADQVRATLATANGEYFTSAPLEQPDGRRGGVLFAYQGETPWMFLTSSRPASAAPVTIELVTHAGAVHTLATDVPLSSASPWGAIIPVAVHDVAVVRVLDGDGELVLSARPLP